MTHLPAHNCRLFLSELQQAARSCDLARGRALHAQIFKAGFTVSSLLATALVNLYAKCGALPDSLLQFDNPHTPKHDPTPWNYLINGFSAYSAAVMSLFNRMRSANVFPNPRTFSGVFRAASSLSDASGGRQAHAVAIKAGALSDVYVGSSAVNMYCKSGFLSDARRMFDRMSDRNTVSWSTMISGYAMQRLSAEAFGVFVLMRREVAEENEFVFTSVLSALTHQEWVGQGRQVHGLAVKNGLLAFVSVGNALVTMYAKCGTLDDAIRTFEMCGEKNPITWSAMITGYAQSGNSNEAVRLFTSMHYSWMAPSEFTIVGVLNACSDVEDIIFGKQVHGYSLKLGFEPQIFVATTLIDMYAKCGCVAGARKGFDCLQEPEIALWSSMIGGYVQNGENEEALSLYSRLEGEGILPNELTMASVLKACTSIAALEQGKQLHARIVKYGLCLEAPIGSALSTMYAKCGSFEDGSLVFRRMLKRDVMSWNAMISGLSQNGRGKEALELMEEMLMEGTRPDSVTFVNILSACSHMGLVEEGWRYFNLMAAEFGLVPQLEHYACMVDVLSRAGRLKEAKEFIESATVDHGMCLWRILLSASRIYRDYDLGVYAGEKLMELGSQESSAYVLLAAVYSALGRREDVERVWKTMKLRRVRKERGCSWFELKCKVHVFVGSDDMHPEIGQIRLELCRLYRQMTDESHGPVLTSF